MSFASIKSSRIVALFDLIVQVLTIWWAAQVPSSCCWMCRLSRNNDRHGIIPVISPSPGVILLYQWLPRPWYYLVIPLITRPLVLSCYTSDRPVLLYYLVIPVIAPSPGRYYLVIPVIGPSPGRYYLVIPVIGPSPGRYYLVIPVIGPSPGIIMHPRPPGRHIGIDG